MATYLPNPSDFVNPYRFAGGDPVSRESLTNFVTKSVVGTTQDMGWWSRISSALDAVPNPVWAGLQIVGGVTQIAGGIVVGITTGWSGVGIVGGALLALRGLDDVQAGVRSLWSGQPVETVTHQVGMKLSGGNQYAATGFEIATGLVSPGAMLKIASGMKAVNQLGRAGKMLDAAADARIISQVDTVSAVSKLSAPRGTMNTFSSGSGRYAGGPKLSIDDAYRLGREHGIDMRQFKLEYVPGNEYDFGSVGRYFNPKTMQPGDIVRSADGRIELRLFDKALRSPQDLIETLSHELNHVRAFYKTGVFSPEAAAEAAAEAARPFMRPR